MKVTISYVKHLAIPIVIICLGFLLADFLKALDREVLFVLAYLPYFFLCISAWLCAQFNQSRMLFSLISIFIVYFIIHSLQFSILRLYEFILIFWALTNIAILAYTRERSVLSIHSLFKLVVIAAQAAITWYCLIYQFLFLENIFYSTALSAPPEWMNVSWLLFTTCSLVLIAVSVRFILRPGPILAAHLVLVLILISLISSASPAYLLISMALSAAAIVFMAVQFDSHTMAYRDELTQLRSRRALNQYITGLGRKYTIAMIDIDHFKNFNDSHGHDVGDQMLKLVASRIAKVRGGGTPFRYGGEEFTVIFPRKDIKQVKQDLESLREIVEGYPLVIRANDRPKKIDKNKPKRKAKSKTLSCTISIGIASRNARIKSPEQVIKAADQALYRAKGKGRNCLST